MHTFLNAYFFECKIICRKCSKIDIFCNPPFPPPGCLTVGFCLFLPFRLSLNCGALGSQVFGTISVFCAISLLFWKIPGFWAIAAFWVRKSFYEVLDSLGVLINQQNCILPPFRNDNPNGSKFSKLAPIKNLIHPIKIQEILNPAIYYQSSCPRHPFQKSI